MSAFVGACSEDGAAPQGQQPRGGPDAEKDGGTLPEKKSGPIGLAIEIENGAGVPLRVRAGETFYVNQLDIRASMKAAVDEGVSGLDVKGDFAALSWSGVQSRDTEPVLGKNAYGAFTRRRFYRSASWMEAQSTFSVSQLKSSGEPVGDAAIVSAGKDSQRSGADGFFVRRMRAIQWTYDCISQWDCTGASNFEEEALVELRHSLHPEGTFKLHPQTAALRVTWSLKPDSPYLVPIEQVPSPAYDYGFSIDLTPLSTVGPSGVYEAGQDIVFQLTLRDGSGKRLHPQGSLPTYNDVEFGSNEAGIQYYRAFFDPTATYWRRKHRERMLMTQIVGPAQAIQPLRSLIPLAAFLDDEEVEHIGTIARDGVFSDFRTFPPSKDLFGGAFDAMHSGWSAPVSDTFIYHLPADAPAGTYLVTAKGRRTYLGEDIPYSRTIKIQVGTPVPSEAVLTTGQCSSCHDGEGALGKLLHGNDNRAACAGCHAPLSFELEGPIVVRTHFIHSRSARFGGNLQQCSSCHLTAQSLARTSKAVCLSCHSSYPASHVAMFGPVRSAYVGGGAESFEQCATTCHTSHPGSGL